MIWDQGPTREQRRDYYANLMEAVNAGKVTLDDFSLRRCFERLVGPAEMLMRAGPSTNPFDGQFAEAEGITAQGTAAFKKVTSELIAKKTIEAYDLAAGIADQLVTNYPTSMKNEDFVGFDAVQGVQTVAEGEEYPQGGYQEKWVGTDDALKKGRIIALTKEAIFHDQTGQILLQAQRLGEAARYQKEKTIIDAIQDINAAGTSNQVFFPKGAAEALYRTSAGTNSDTVNKKASNALADWSDVDNVIQVFVDMTDEEGRYIGVPNRLMLLVPEALRQTASYVLAQSTVLLGRTSQGDYAATAPAVKDRNIMGPLSSVHLDAQSSTTWYLGDFPRQFLWRDLWPISVEVKRDNIDDMFTRDVAVAYKVSYYGGVACIDDKYVVQSAA